MSRKFLTLMTSQLLTSYLEANIAKKKINLSSIVIIYVKLHHSWRKTWNFVFHFNGKNTFTVRSRVHVSSNTRVECERWSRLIKKTLAIVEVHFVRFWTNFTPCLSAFMAVFKKQVNVQCGNQCWYPHTVIMQPTTPLQRTADKATSKNLKFYFLENNRVQ